MLSNSASVCQCLVFLAEVVIVHHSTPPISHSLQMLPSVIGQFIGQVFPSSFSPQKTTWKSKYELKQHVNRYLYLICNVISNLLWKSSPSVIKTDASACTYKEGDWLWRRTLKGRIKYYDIALHVPQCLYD